MLGKTTKEKQHNKVVHKMVLRLNQTGACKEMCCHSSRAVKEASCILFVPVLSLVCSALHLVLHNGVALVVFVHLHLGLGAARAVSESEPCTAARSQCSDPQMPLRYFLSPTNKKQAVHASRCALSLHRSRQTSKNIPTHSTWHHTWPESRRQK